MIVFDIDNTISPTTVEDGWNVPHETRRAWGFDISIPLYVLNFLRNRDDIALLSTWDAAAVHISKEFGFKAVILTLDDGIGIKGKFEVARRQDNMVAWIDDHMKPYMKKEMHERGVLAIKPTGGVISEKQLARVANLSAS